MMKTNKQTSVRSKPPKVPENILEEAFIDPACEGEVGGA